MNAVPEGPMPEVLFLCVHNAGRSQMAAALMEELGQDRVRVRSAGSDPTDALNPAVVESLAEIGVDIRGRRPQRMDPEMARSADVVVTMGCGDSCPVFPGKRYLDWPVSDPAGKSLPEVRTIRDDIEARVRSLLEQLLPRPPD